MRLPSMISDVFLAEMIEMAEAAPPGCFVEVGVYKGGSAQRLYEVAQQQGRVLYLFDTFTGMPFAGSMDGWAVGQLDATGYEAVVREVMPRAIVRKGIFPETLSPVFYPNVAFVHADADQYQSTKDVCERLYPLLVKGGIILFDDYNDSKTRGCTEAVNTFVASLPKQVMGGHLYKSPRNRFYIVKACA